MILKKVSKIKFIFYIWKIKQMNKTFSYKNNSNYKSLDNLNKTKRIILNKKSDLINIPLKQLRTTQLKNFTGTLFEQI